MSKTHQVYINNNRIYSCATCHSHLISQDDIISRAFQGRHGPAYFVDHVANITVGAKEERVLMTGLHTVADISCVVCLSKIGWKYIYANESNQKYKENKCIVEKAKITKEVSWD
ncbi:hypothetical protein BJ944DRAFT_177075 [Cunninghamella echinulata]|nr:hypothetical protein BJ944DRAFT_177075 [Cunninghamella echinulata]